uniref:Uncharacterized protein n=1 Tax=Trypanosoma vivax (strain Y486) TaxID=1055687 RepID=G0UBF2_TRYVY|nr:hypothetical protein TVY486_1106310 [Trypanosoma vivax Y486]
MSITSLVTTVFECAYFFSLSVSQQTHLHLTTRKVSPLRTTNFPPSLVPSPIHLYLPNILLCTRQALPVGQSPRPIDSGQRSVQGGGRTDTCFTVLTLKRRRWGRRRGGESGVRTAVTRKLFLPPPFPSTFYFSTRHSSHCPIIIIIIIIINLLLEVFFTVYASGSEGAHIGICSRRVETNRARAPSPNPQESHGCRSRHWGSEAIEGFQFTASTHRLYVYHCHYPFLLHFHRFFSSCLSTSFYI